MISISELVKILLSKRNIAIFCHMRPDGDSIGSAFAISRALKYFGVKNSVFSSDIIPKKFMFLDDVKEVKYELDGEYECFLAIDSADIARLGKFTEEFSSHKDTIVIDHHISNPLFAKVNYVVDNASNSENIFYILEEMKYPIDSNTANLLATGIMTDTGNFRHKNVTPKTLVCASKLLSFGADLNKIAYYMFTEQTKERAKLFGITMSKLRFFMNGKIAFATVLKDDLAKSGALADETEGFIDFVMGIEGVEVGVCILETEDNKFKVSLRSKTANVNEVAQNFGGGGHILASGCQIKGDYEEVVDRLRFEISKYIEE